MGLTVSVGVYTDDLDADVREQYLTDFRLINRILKAAGLSAHKEKPSAEDLRWNVGMGYSRLHFLRRFAASVAVTGRVPTPLRRNATATTSPEIRAYCSRVVRPSSRLFDHLMCHSDAEGYYVPIDFPSVLNADQAVPLTGGYLGSSVRLRDECRMLADHLELPDADFDLDDDGEWKRLKIATHGAVWHRYPIEAFACAALRSACTRSIELKAAIVFG
ncbi:Uncharacterized protein OS=Kitasatospora cheerisanensis KCTC 2395 GN=KCH_17260 PE=4 SV=1 [Gemmataceae bacterium]|nr:Uncharacterized protein OS=Kitasatospora cheerisanensis KCTC 2395 GN=KCH_17260 PE=4 SV=1 [Gemmataceae bacterium]VTT96893.1 Uncharacterized protein OS=Kitasatospora cheerisanensis KCTC 2395 GN=KCH_17260 PE=4 SV=1 [Gemmataceae bacterium]